MQGWFLADLENVARDGADPATAGDGFKSVAWTPDTLDTTTGCYTTKSDMHLVGLLLTDGQVSDHVKGDVLLLREELLKPADQLPDAVTAPGYLQPAQHQ